MHPSRSFFLTAVATLAMLAATPLAAGAADIPARGPIPFASYDLNHDGFISPGEFNQVQEQRQDARLANGGPARQMRNAPSFEDFDTNSDDRISPDELQAGQQAQRQQRMEQRSSMGSGQGTGARKGMAQRPKFEEFDHNGDGNITPEEFDTLQEKRMQKRSDEGRMMKHAADAPAFADMDGNGDGKISRQEFIRFHRQRQPMGPGRQGN